MKIIFIAGFFILLAACTKAPQGPTETLGKFIEYRFATNQTKDGLLHYMTSKASAEIQAMSESDLTDLFKVDRFRKRNFQIVNEKCTEEKCFITYVLEYDVLAANNTREFIAEVKKIAELQKIGDEWKVANIDNIKTFIDSTRPIDVK